MARLLDLSRFVPDNLRRDPYDWASIGELFPARDAAALAASFPRDHYKTMDGYDGEKGWVYEVRSLIPMGKSEPAFGESLTPAWRHLVEDLVSPEYRAAMSRLVGLDLTGAWIEGNLFHYGPNAWMGPHVDLKIKIVTHVLYFNDEWNEADGGCVSILRSSEMSDVAATIPPVVGNSFVLVRSDRSWHAVPRIAPGCRKSRRALVLTFYPPGAVSSMWPPGDAAPLHYYGSRIAEAMHGVRQAFRRLVA